QKIAFNGGNHIWMMNSDGSHLSQVTASSSVEKKSTFSPTGDYLLIGRDWHKTGPFGALWYLAIIPADGQKYNVDKGVDDRVIVLEDDHKKGQAASKLMVWR